MGLDDQNTGEEEGVAAPRDRAGERIPVDTLSYGDRDLTEARSYEIPSPAPARSVSRVDALKVPAVPTYSNLELNLNDQAIAAVPVDTSEKELTHDFEREISPFLESLVYLLQNLQKVREVLCLSQNKRVLYTSLHLNSLASILEESGEMEHASTQGLQDKTAILEHIKKLENDIARHKITMPREGKSNDTKIKDWKNSIIHATAETQGLMNAFVKFLIEEKNGLNNEQNQNEDEERQLANLYSDINDYKEIPEDSRMEIFIILEHFLQYHEDHAERPNNINSRSINFLRIVYQVLSAVIKEDVQEFFKTKKEIRTIEEVDAMFAEFLESHYGLAIRLNAEKLELKIKRDVINEKLEAMKEVFDELFKNTGSKTNAEKENQLIESTTYLFEKYHLEEIYLSYLEGNEIIELSKLKQIMNIPEFGKKISKIIAGFRLSGATFKEIIDHLQNIFSQEIHKIESIINGGSLTTFAAITPPEPTNTPTQQSKTTRSRTIALCAAAGIALAGVAFSVFGPKEETTTPSTITVGTQYQAAKALKPLGPYPNPPKITPEDEKPETTEDLRLWR